MKKHSNFKQKRFHLLKRPLYQNGKGQNVPVVAGRLVSMITLNFTTV